MLLMQFDYDIAHIFLVLSTCCLIIGYISVQIFIYLNFGIKHSITNHEQTKKRESEIGLDIHGFLKMRKFWYWKIRYFETSTTYLNCWKSENKRKLKICYDLRKIEHVTSNSDSSELVMKFRGNDRSEIIRLKAQNPEEAKRWGEVITAIHNKVSGVEFAVNTRKDLKSVPHNASLLVRVCALRSLVNSTTIIKPEVAINSVHVHRTEQDSFLLAFISSTEDLDSAFGLYLKYIKFILDKHLILDRYADPNTFYPFFISGVIRILQSRDTAGRTVVWLSVKHITANVDFDEDKATAFAIFVLEYLVRREDSRVNGISLFIDLDNISLHSFLWNLLFNEKWKIVVKMIRIFQSIMPLDCENITLVNQKISLSILSLALPSYIRSRVRAIGYDRNQLHRIILPQNLPIDLYGTRNVKVTVWLDTRIQSLLAIAPPPKEKTSLELLKMCLDPTKGMNVNKKKSK